MGSTGTTLKFVTKAGPRSYLEPYPTALSQRSLRTSIGQLWYTILPSVQRGFNQDSIRPYRKQHPRQSTCCVAFRYIMQNVFFTDSAVAFQSALAQSYGLVATKSSVIAPYDSEGYVSRRSHDQHFQIQRRKNRSKERLKQRCPLLRSSR